MATRPVVLYDANVLYPAQLRDFLMRLAVHGLIRAHWSEAIHAKWMRKAKQWQRYSFQLTNALASGIVNGTGYKRCVLFAESFYLLTF